MPKLSNATFPSSLTPISSNLLKSFLILSLQEHKFLITIIDHSLSVGLSTSVFEYDKTKPNLNFPS